MDLRDILLNRHDGAAELLARAVRWFREHPEVLSPTRVEQTLRILRETRPAMAGFALLADCLQDARTAGKSLDQVVRSVEAELAESNRRIAERFGRKIAGRQDLTVVTLSWSSTVIEVLLRHAPAIGRVNVLESAPGGEGARTRDRLQRSGMAATLYPDKELPEACANADLGLIGADAVYEDGSVLNKVLSRRLGECLAASGRPLFVVASRWKRGRSAGARDEDREAGPIFEHVPAQLVTAVLSE